VPQLRIGSAAKFVQNNWFLFWISSANSYFYITLKLNFTDFIKNSSA
jgi:hypothetical protein